MDSRSADLETKIKGLDVELKGYKEQVRVTRSLEAPVLRNRLMLCHFSSRRRRGRRR